MLRIQSVKHISPKIKGLCPWNDEIKFEYSDETVADFKDLFVFIFL